MMESIKKALRPNGKIFIIEYRGEDPRVPIKKIHKMTEKQVVKEMKAIGLKLEVNMDNLPWQHCLIFEIDKKFNIIINLMSVSKEQESLVKYDTPILVSTSAKKANASASQLPAVKVQPSQQRAEDYLNSILPPQEFTDKGKLWVRYVSPTPATKVDVVLLKELLNKRLDHGKARDVGICPIRETLFQ